MSHISIGESRQKKFKVFSRATEAIEGTDHSHLFVSWKDTYGLRWVAEARGSGVRIVSNVEFKRDSEVKNLYRYKYANADLEYDVLKYMWAQSAKKYGWLQIAGIFYMRLGNYVSRIMTGKNRHKNPFRDGETSQICCEFAVRVACIAMGTDVPKDIDSYGLIETKKFNLGNGDLQSKELVASINDKA